MRNHSEKLLNVNCANSIFLKQTILGEKCAERSDKHFKPTTFERRWDMNGNRHFCVGVNTISDPTYTNSQSTYRQTLGYNKFILRQAPLSGDSLSAVAFLD